MAEPYRVHGHCMSIYGHHYGEAMTKPSSKLVSKSGQSRPKPPNAGMGRPKGVPNKATANAREAIARFVDGNAERLQGWLDQIAETDGPKAAWQCFMDTLEFHVPKLARTEHTGADGGPQEHVMTIAILPVKPRE